MDKNKSADKLKNIENVIKPIVNNETDFVFGTRFQDDKTKFPFFKELPQI
jgi:hypothetical protein